MIGDWLNYDTPLQKVVAFAAKARPPKQDQYVRNDAAQKWASKLRSSIAGVYAWRAEHAAGETDKTAMAREADFAFRQAVAVCPYAAEAVFRYTSSLYAQKRISDAILVAETAAAPTPDNVHDVVTSSFGVPNPVEIPGVNAGHLRLNRSHYGNYARLRHHGERYKHQIQPCLVLSRLLDSTAVAA